MKYLKFYSPTCTHCKVADKVLKEKGIEFESINAAEDFEARTVFEIRAVPTVVVLDNEGNEVKRAVGIPEIQNL